MCEFESWIPNAVVETLLGDRATKPVIAWLTAIRASIEEYDPLVIVRPPTPDLSASPDSAFDEILSHLGKEIYQLDQYHNNLVPREKEVSLSILNIFDECLDNMTDKWPSDPTGSTSKFPIEHKWTANFDDDEEVYRLEDKSVSECNQPKSKSDCEITKFVTSTPSVQVSDRRTRLSGSTSSSIYDNLNLDDGSPEWTKLIESDSEDSESTCWSYKECSDGETDVNNPYTSVWVLSSGYHNSDKILQRVLSKNRATVSRLSFDTAGEFTSPEYNVYALEEVGDRYASPVATMTPNRPYEDSYEPVKDAITDENIYEEIEFNYTDEGCSCGSVEVESCSLSASSEGVGRESPLYQNLMDNNAYTITPDVIFWKNLLQDPYYIDDEEDEWITPEECEVYSRDQRPPLVIPRITNYRVPRPRPQQHMYHDDTVPSIRNYDPLGNWSPTSEKTRVELERSYNKDDSPRVNKRLGGSTENLLLVNARRPQQLQLPASSSGDSLDVEVRRDYQPVHGRNRKVRSLVHRRSPVPIPRTILPPSVEAPLLEGPVKRTKFFEGGKKSRKNWTDSYMILTPTALKFFKDYKTYHKNDRPPGTPPSPTAPQPEVVIPLRTAKIEQCIPMHTRRHTRSLVLFWNFDQYLIQYETEDGARKWYHAVRSLIMKLGQYPQMPTESPNYQSSSTDLESLGRTPPASRHQNRNKRAGGSSNEDLSDSTEVSKSHVRSRLRKFFAKRPAMEVLVRKGIYKDEPVFGKNLDEVCPKTSPRVPEFVVTCVSEIERTKDNMCTDGLYRASGNLSQVQKIRLEIDQNNMSVIQNNTDIHVLTGSLKLFFRELKEPLIPCSYFDKILAACSIKPKEAKIKEFRDIIQSLPPCNRETLKFLLEHLLRVTTYSEQNRMHTANLAIVFGPTLLWAPAEQAHNIAVDCIQQNNVVDILLNEFKDIFPEDNKGKKKA